MVGIKWGRNLVGMCVLVNKPPQPARPCYDRITKRTKKRMKKKEIRASNFKATVI